LKFSGSLKNKEVEMVLQNQTGGLIPPIESDRHAQGKERSGMKAVRRNGRKPSEIGGPKQAEISAIRA
jgi:hypothetical protein